MPSCGLSSSLLALPFSGGGDVDWGACSIPSFDLSLGGIRLVRSVSTDRYDLEGRGDRLDLFVSGESSVSLSVSFALRFLGLLALLGMACIFGENVADLGETLIFFLTGGSSKSSWASSAVRLLEL